MATESVTAARHTDDDVGRVVSTQQPKWAMARALLISLPLHLQYGYHCCPDLQEEKSTCIISLSYGMDGCL